MCLSMVMLILEKLMFVGRLHYSDDEKRRTFQKEKPVVWMRIKVGNLYLGL